MNDLDRAVELNDKACDFAEAGKLGEAIIWFQKAIDAYHLYPDAHMNLASCLDRAGQPDQAIGLYKKALACYAVLEEAHGSEFTGDDRDRKAMIHQEMGITYQRMGNNKMADEC